MLTTNEPCTNGVVNAGETVTVNLALQNVGSAPTTNLVATLLSSNGIVFPSAPQTYGALPVEVSATNTFSFFADGTCGQTIVATLQLQDGTNSLGTVSYSFQLGLPFSMTNFTQNFDGVLTGTMPAGWTTSVVGSGLNNWTTESTNVDTPPNSVYCPDAAVPGAVYLYSPTIAVITGANQLSFRNSFNLEETYDGGVLEIAIAGGSFNDILAAGGSFVTGGYNGGLSDLGDRPRDENPLIGRQAWTGNSDGFITTVVNLPAAASGTNIQLRWICGTDRGNDNLVGAGGWWIDTISISQPGFDCTNCLPPNVLVPTIISPTNGYQITTISPEVLVAGLAPADSTVTISTNGVSDTTVTADGNGVYTALTTLNFGPNTLAVTAAANSSTNVVVYLKLGPPILDVPPVANPPVPISGMGAPGATVYLYEGDSTNGTLLTNFVVNPAGNFSGSITLPIGNSTLTATETISGQTSTNTTSVSVSVVYLTLGPPTLDAPPVANPNVGISGTGAVGATVHIYEGDSTNGTSLTNFLVGASGNFSGSITLPLGSDTLIATETIGGQTSSNSAPVSVNVVPEPPPAIVSPTNGLVVNKVSLTISGKGEAGAIVTISDVTEGGTFTLATPAVNSGGKFSAVVELADGINTLFATQTLNGTTSPASATVVVAVYLGPAILVQPENQTNFLKGTATFSAVVSGAAPLKLFWETNGIKIRGSDSSKLTLSNLKTTQAGYVYSLVASNKYGVVNSASVTLTLVTNPFTNLAGSYYGLFAESNAQFESSGLLTLNLTSQGKFTARILCAGGSYSFSGALSGVGWESNTVSRGPALTPLWVVLDLNVTNGMEQILGTVSAGTNWSAALEADRATFSSVKDPFPQAGKFTLIFGNTNSGAQSPGGDGYGTVSVTAAGLVSLSGVLSDNTSVAPGAVSVSKNGRWPLYIPLYGKFGSLEGWIEFTNEGSSSFTGSNAMWFRTNADGKLYPGGFTNSLAIIGSTFDPNNISALTNLSNLQVTLSGGNLPDAVSNSVALSSRGKFILDGAGISGLTLSLSPSTGVIKGSFTDPVTQASAPIKGVVFQEQTNAAGFFLGGATSGKFLLTPP